MSNVNRGNNNTGSIGDQISQSFGTTFNNTTGAQTAEGNERAGRGDRSRVSDRGGSNVLMRLATGQNRTRPQADLEAFRQRLEESIGRGFAKSAVVSNASDVKVILLDRGNTKYKLDLIAAILPVSADGKDHMVVHTLLVADASDRYDNATWSVAGERFEYTRVVGDAYSEELTGRLEARIAAISGNTKAVFVDAGHQSIPGGVDLKNEAMVDKLAFFVTEALTRTAKAQVLDEVDDIITLGLLKQVGTPTLDMTFSGTPLENVLELPVRADIVTTLRYIEGNGDRNDNQQNRAFEDGTDMSMGLVGAYVDLSFEAPESAGFGHQQRTQHYWAHYVITKFDTDQQFVTPESLMLNLVTAVYGTRDMNWARGWSQRYRGMGPVSHDIGAIGWELPGVDGKPGVAIDTSSSNFDDKALAQLVHATIRPEIQVEIDIEESGELSWIHRTLLAEAQGDISARNMLVDVFDNLTDGEFSKIYSGGPFARDTENRIHLGYYTHENSDKPRDIRDLDYLAILGSYGEDDPELVVRWQETFDGTLGAEERLANREEIIRALLGPTVKITGYARRVRLMPDALSDVLEAFERAGLRIKPADIRHDFGRASARGAGSRLSDTGFSGGNRVVFSGGSGQGSDRRTGRTYTGLSNSWRGRGGR